MVNSVASPPASAGSICTNFKEPFILLDKLSSGSPLPSNVLDGVNPYICEPQNLPVGCWFLINSKESINTENGFWKTKGEACEVFSDTNVIGWRTNLEAEYRERHYVMEVFSTTQKRLYDENEKKETISLSRVLLVPSEEVNQNVSSAGVDTETRNNMTHPPVLNAHSSTRISSSRNPEVKKHDEKEALAVAERLPAPGHHEDHLGNHFSREQLDYFSRSGDFLEIQDLDNPQSPSSSSENSSAMSVSSDNFSDAIRLEDLDDPIVEQNDASRRLNVSAAKKPDEVVVIPATLESLVSVDGSNSDGDAFLKTAGSKDPNNKVKKHAKGDQRNEGPSSSSSPKPSTSSGSSMGAPSGGRKRTAFGGMKNLRKKYLCFLPF
ncbi:No apical meristem (NAM) protein [Corchorus capsularis]|uniref:No apical meristem (NAM) protein n=1 Tax=Corchorus capsularis TaxID=210143 RepID=A0A1R3IYI6_COCAP|nr:No apical meristem (NAM) protein [Corchorus capsularis]